MKVEKKQLDKVQVELTIEIPQDEFKEYVEKAYRDKKGKINIPGFRKGHAPRQLIEQYYGRISSILMQLNSAFSLSM